ncbi:MAG: mannitol dehydrogenase family protein, partial [Oxalobacteraceae bacterium]
MYTVVERSAEGSKARIIGSITSYIYAPGNTDAVIAKMAHADTRIVSLTITESGYYCNEATGELDAKHPDIVYDLAGKGAPRTVYGYLFSALKKRFDDRQRPFTVMSCDNVQQNGTMARKMLLAFAKARDPKLAEWISENGAFPNSMVDRITPRTHDADKVSLAEHFGVEDAWPVVTEPFMQWVIEDDFADGRPLWEKVGVQVVGEVEPFELMKLRLLNASHSAMGYLGYLAGFTYIHEVINHPQFHKYIHNMMQQEVKPLLPHIPGVNIDAYCDTLLHRFANPTIQDQVTRICMGGSGKMPKFIMPSISDQVARGGKHRRLALCVASWFRYLTGKDEHGKAFTIDDPMAKELQAKALTGGNQPMVLLGVESLFGDDLRHSKVFVEELTSALESLYRDGALATLAKYVE